MIWILLSILYVALGYLYSEAAWNSVEIREEIERMRETRSPQMVNSCLAAAKIICTAIWPLFLLGSLLFYTLWKVGIIHGGEE